MFAAHPARGNVMFTLADVNALNRSLLPCAKSKSSQALVEAARQQVLMSVFDCGFNRSVQIARSTGSVRPNTDASSR